MPENFQTDVESINSIAIVPKLLEVICRTTGMGFAAIARVTEDKWITCSARDEILFGLKPGDELKVETTICNEIRQTGYLVAIDHVAQDELFRDHHTPKLYGFQSYISVPINRRDGTLFGTLCAIDPQPARVNNIETIGMFTLFTDLISFHLEAIEKLNATETKLVEERKTANLREQFIAILGHDLRNPVGAILNVAQILLRMPLDERTLRLANIVQDSSYRMKALIDNILDFARGRLGEGITLNKNKDEQTEKMLKEVITELSIMWPERTIDVKLSLAKPVNCDGKRLAQLFSNLLGNALTHGKKDKPITVRAASFDDEFILTVANSGKKIPEAAIERLFQPFSRGEVKPGQQGLGLGLYIASEIAKAHGGNITVSSTSYETMFTLTIPSK